MARIGTTKIGFAKVAVAVGADGTETETISDGMISTYPRSFTATSGSSNTSIYAGDREVDVIGDYTGTLKVELERDDLTTRAIVCGGTYNAETKEYVEAQNDERPFVRVASISPVRESGVTRYELTEIWRGRLYPPDNSDKTKEKSISAQYITYNGEYLPNADGKRRSVISFATEALAITAAKTFLGIAT